MKIKKMNSCKSSIFDRWLDKETDETLTILKKIGISLVSLGPILFVFGLISIIMAIYSFSTKAPTNPLPNKISFYIFLVLYILVYLGIAIIGLFLVPAFRLLPKIKKMVILVIYLSVFLIPSLALIIMGKWCIFISKHSNEYQYSVSEDIKNKINEQAIENIPSEIKEE